MAAQAGLCLAWSETPEDTFSHDEAQLLLFFHCLFAFGLLFVLFICLGKPGDHFPGKSFDNCCHTATKFAVSVKEDQERLPTIYWLPKLHKSPCKARFIANSSSCTTTELSKLLLSCLTAIKKHLIKYCEKVYERPGKNPFWSIKNYDEVRKKTKLQRFSCG